jgi:hypothetical protein
LEAAMKIKRLLVSLAAIMLFAFAATLKGNQVVARDQTVARPQVYKTPWQKIEEQAKLENPSDGNSVRALVDEIFNYPHSFGEIPPVMDTIVKERLTQAEMKYKLGLGPGVQESDIVHIANTLADKFQLPDYARTTLHQVEVLRVSYELSSPVFMGVPSPRQDSGTSQSSPSNPTKLSPAQATFLLLTLVDAKLMWPDYQLPPDEWEKTRYGPMMENLVKYKELKESGQQSKLQTRGTLGTFTTPTRDIRTLVSRGISEMSLTDGLDLVDQAFAAVGIGK